MTKNSSIETSEPQPKPPRHGRLYGVGNVGAAGRVHTFTDAEKARYIANMQAEASKQAPRLQR